MASYVTNYAKQQFINGGLQIGVHTFKLMLLKTHPTSGFQDTNFVGTLLGADGGVECNATNYTGGFGGGGRKTVTLAANEEDANDRSTITISADTTWTALGGAANNTITSVALIREITNDAASPLIAVFDITDTPTNGSDFTIQFQTDAGTARTVLKFS